MSFAGNCDSVRSVFSDSLHKGYFSVKLHVSLPQAGYKVWSNYNF